MKYDRKENFNVEPTNIKLLDISVCERYKECFIEDVTVFLTKKINHIIVLNFDKLIKGDVIEYFDWKPLIDEDFLSLDYNDRTVLLENIEKMYKDNGFNIDIMNHAQSHFKRLKISVKK